MTSSHVGEFFNENKNAENDLIFKRSTGSNLKIPLTYEHVGLKHQYVYGDLDAIDKDIPIIGEVDEIYKKNGSYYANFNFKNGKGPIIGKDENWYLSASDDNNKVIEFGLTKNPKRTVTHIKKMTDSTQNSENQKHFQMILENEKNRLLENHPENSEKKEAPIPSEPSKPIDPEKSKVNELKNEEQEKLIKSLEEKDKIIAEMQKKEVDMEKEKKSQQEVLKQMQTAIMEIWNDQNLRDARSKYLSNDHLSVINSTPIGRELLMASNNNDKDRTIPGINHVGTMTFMLGLMKQKRQGVDQTNSDIENLPSSNDVSTKKRRLIA